MRNESIRSLLLLFVTPQLAVFTGVQSWFLHCNTKKLHGMRNIEPSFAHLIILIDVGLRDLQRVSNILFTYVLFHHRHVLFCARSDLISQFLILFIDIDAFILSLYLLSALKVVSFYDSFPFPILMKLTYKTHILTCCLPNSSLYFLVRSVLLFLPRSRKHRPSLHSLMYLLPLES